MSKPGMHHFRPPVGATRRVTECSAIQRSTSPAESSTIVQALLSRGGARQASRGAGGRGLRPCPAHRRRRPSMLHVSSLDQAPDKLTEHGTIHGAVWACQAMLLQTSLQGFGGPELKPMKHIVLLCGIRRLCRACVSLCS